MQLLQSEFNELSQLLNNKTKLKAVSPETDNDIKKIELELKTKNNQIQKQELVLSKKYTIANSLIYEMFDKVPNHHAHQQAIKFIDFLLKNIDELAVAYKNELENSHKIVNLANRLKTDHNEIIAIKNQILHNSTFWFDPFIAKMLKFKKEAENYVSHSKNFNNLSQFDGSLHFDFYYFAETVLEIYNEFVERLESFSVFSENISKIIKKVDSLIEINDLFNTRKSIRFNERCEDEKIPEHKRVESLKEWELKNLEVYKKVSKFLELYFSHKINIAILIDAFNNSELAIRSIDDFYLNDKIAIIQNADQWTAKESIERFETDEKLISINSKFEDDTIKSVEKAQNSEVREIMPFLSSTRKEILSQIATNAISSEISEVIKNGWKKFDEELKHVFLTDVKDISARLQKQRQEVNSLLYRMKRDLEQIGKSE